MPGISLAYVSVVTDFDNGNLESPVACSVSVVNGTASISAEPGGMGTYSLHASYSLANPYGFAFLQGTFLPGLFRGKGLFFYARERGVWDLAARVQWASTPAYYRLSLSDDWQAYYIAWEDFSYGL